jgi:hypothetical protein
MTPEHLKTLSSFFDGERVDESELAAGLADPDAASFLADCAAIRLRVLSDQGRPSDRFYASMEEALRRSPWRRLAGHRYFPASVAAGLVLAAGLAGFQLGTLAGQRELPAFVPTAAQTGTAAEGTRTMAGTAEARPPAAGLRLRFDGWREAGETARE